MDENKAGFVQELGELLAKYSREDIAGMMVIPWALWLVDTAFKSFWLWAN